MKHGKVTSVYYEKDVVKCDVQPIRLQTEYPKVPVRKSHSSLIEIPEQNDIVTIEKLDDEKRFITGVVGSNEAPPEDMSEGDFAIHLDENTYVSFQQNGSSYDLELSASGDITINADGDVFINGLDFEDHTHEYEDSSDGNTSTKTTNPPT